jgi:hypothetical protein
MFEIGLACGEIKRIKTEVARATARAGDLLNMLEKR